MLTHTVLVKDVPELHMRWSHGVPRPTSELHCVYPLAAVNLNSVASVHRRCEISRESWQGIRFIKRSGQRDL